MYIKKFNTQQEKWEIISLILFLRLDSHTYNYFIDGINHRYVRECEWAENHTVPHNRMP